jgi:hypothetical protein
MQDLIASMDSSWGTILDADLRRWNDALDRGARNGCSTLLYAALHCIDRHLEYGTPLAMPSDVCRVYLADGEAKPQHYCADCGYAIPHAVRGLQSNAPRPASTYFESCPLCDGNVGWHAFFLRTGRRKTQQGLALRRFSALRRPHTR